MSDPVREEFEALGMSLSFERFPDDCLTPWLRGQYKNAPTQTRWDAYLAGRAAALEEAASECDAEASIEGIAQRCAARIRAMVKP